VGAEGVEFEAIAFDGEVLDRVKIQKR
jgi:hypothetical protein